MPSLTIGKLHLSADESGVVVELADDSAVLAPQEVSLLEDFLRSHAPHERRIGFRVPILPLGSEVREQFKVSVLCGKRDFAARAVDVSLTGILLQTEQSLPEREHIRVVLSFADLSCTLDASVVRRDGKLVAMHFLDSLSNGELDPPEALLAIYGQLEQSWLKARVH